MKCIGLIFCVLAVLGLETGCDRQARVSDEAERDHPAMRKARELEEEGKMDAARQTYQALLDCDPTIARAHLSLAFLLDKPEGNYAEALYHYQRYLSLRPDTEKRTMIESRIRSTTLAFVGTVFTNEAAVLKHMGEVERENRELKIRTANLTAQSSQLRATLSVLRAKYSESADHASHSLDAKGLPIPQLRSAGRSIKVEKGDSLRKISGRVYGEQGRWREIYEANKGVMRTPEDLRVGQILLVPQREPE